MTFDKAMMPVLSEALQILNSGFDNLPPFQSDVDMSAVRTILIETAEKMKDNFPYHHPLYLGQMLKPPHTVAMLAYMLCLWINPNNHALDGGRASSQMEKEAVNNLARMVGWKTHLGHLTGGGTMANLEALWVASRLHPGKKILASDQAHYTHERISQVLGIPFQTVKTDSLGRMRRDILRELLKNNDVGTVVATIGTTATGSVDPLVDILSLQEQFNFRIHADAAYGGYYKLADNLTQETAFVYEHLSEVDSIVIDPHKHGLQPFGCGCTLFRDPSVGIFYKHESPYTYFSSDDLHLGEISLECSRPGAAAVALWATQKMFPYVKKGQFAENLEKCREAALKFFGMLQKDDRFMIGFFPELDIVVWAVKSKDAKTSSKLAARLFQTAANLNLHLALANLPRHLFEERFANFDWNQDQLTCLRVCLMKPEHYEWLPQIWNLLNTAMNDALG